jgi:hypothetical protein
MTCLLESKPKNLSAWVDSYYTPKELRNLEQFLTVHGSPSGTNVTTVPINDIYIDVYQRNLNKSHIKKMLKNNNGLLWHSFGAADISVRKGGKYKGLFNIWDAQQRVVMAKLCGVEEIPCNLYELTYEQEASSYLDRNKHNYKVRPEDAFRAGIVAGEKADLDMLSFLMDVGVEIGGVVKDALDSQGKIYSDLRQSSNGITGLRESIKNNGKHNTKDAMLLFKSSWPTKIPVHTYLVQGLAFLLRHNSGIDRMLLGQALVNIAKNESISQFTKGYIDKKMEETITYRILLSYNNNCRYEGRKKSVISPKTMFWMFDPSYHQMVNTGKRF